MHKKINWILIGIITGLIISGGYVAYSAISQQVGINIQTPSGSWAPVTGGVNATSAVATPSNTLNVDSFNFGFNGTTWDSLESSSSTNLAASPSLGILAVSETTNAACTSTPAAGSQATCSLAAGSGTVRHYPKTVTACVFDSAALAAIQVNLRDGATGVGTVIWSALLGVPAGSSNCITVPNPAKIGSATTAMTLEFAAAGAGTTVESVTLSALNVQ